MNEIFLSIGFIDNAGICILSSNVIPEFEVDFSLEVGITDIPSLISVVFLPSTTNSLSMVVFSSILSIGMRIALALKNTSEVMAERVNFITFGF